MSEVKQMTAKEVFFGTMPFVWAKLWLGVATVAASIIILAILIGIAWLFDSWGVGFVMFIIWIGLTGIIRFFIMHYVGYLVKAGHIAVITEAVTTGKIPENQVNYGKERVKERFLTSNIYFVLDKLVAGAVRQIQRGVGKVGDMMNFVPGMNYITNLAQFFIKLSLDYIDECCLGYTFYKGKDDAFKSAADGVVIYAQNIKTLLGSAAKTMVYVILGILGITLALFLVLGGLVKLFPIIPGWVAFAVALLLSIAIKWAFIDSFILIRTMVAYMSVAPTTVITFDLYGKLCKLSAKFKELFNKGQGQQDKLSGSESNLLMAEGQSNAQNASYDDSPASAFKDLVNSGRQKLSDSLSALDTPQAANQAEIQEDKPMFCGQCGKPNKNNAKFCVHCGQPL